MSYKKDRTESTGFVYDDHELITSLQTLAAELGYSPSPLDVQNLAEVMPDVSTFERRFGSWVAALAAAGLEGRRSQSDETLLRAVARLERELGAFPTKRQIQSDPNTPSYTTLLTRFGSLSDVRALVRSLDDDQADTGILYP